MAKLQKKYIKKYGISKKAWAAQRAATTSGRGRSKRSRSTSRRTKTTTTHRMAKKRMDIKGLMKKGLIGVGLTALAGPGVGAIGGLALVGPEAAIGALFAPQIGNMLGGITGGGSTGGVGIEVF
jgi:hypothetical protein